MGIGIRSSDEYYSSANNSVRQLLTGRAGSKPAANSQTSSGDFHPVLVNIQGLYESRAISEETMQELGRNMEAYVSSGMATKAVNQSRGKKPRSVSIIGSNVSNLHGADAVSISTGEDDRPETPPSLMDIKPPAVTDPMREIPKDAGVPIIPPLGRQDEAGSTVETGQDGSDEDWLD